MKYLCQQTKLEVHTIMSDEERLANECSSNEKGDVHVPVPHAHSSDSEDSVPSVSLRIKMVWEIKKLEKILDE